MSDLVDKWEEIKVLVESLDLDVRKNAVKGNRSAGTRVRKGLRLLKSLSGDLVKKSLAHDKTDKE